MTAFAFNNSYASLPDRFFARLDPTPVKTPALIKLNTALAAQLGLDADFLRSDEGIAVLAGNKVPDGAEPLAMAYAGHQFGGWVPQLGDGRAILLGEILDRDNIRRDIQIKGAGPTPFSRMGDGRAWLGPVLREYIVSEAMAALGIPTTRALAALSTGEPILREDILPGALLVRVASSHIRVGTFQFFAARQDVEGLRVLTDHVIKRHYPDCKTGENPALALLDCVIESQANLIASWMSVGFIHGVMNTDNMTLSGETIDYGPCAFMDEYDPQKVFSSIDQMGRYAYKNQAAVAQWNLAQLASAMLPIIDDNSDKAIHLATDAINRFPDLFQSLWQEKLCKKIGLSSTADHFALAEDFLDLVANASADFTLVFRHLSSQLIGSGDDPAQIPFFNETRDIENWLDRWRTVVENESISRADALELMRTSNPVYIPRNHRVEDVIQAALKDDFAPLDHLLEAVLSPYEEREQLAAFESPPKRDEIVQRTFCGT